MALGPRYLLRFWRRLRFFIIASVIIRFIDYQYATPQKRLKLIVDLPNSTIYEGKSGIDVVYHQILSASFENVDEDDPIFLISCISWSGLSCSLSNLYHARVFRRYWKWRRKALEHRLPFTFGSYRARIESEPIRILTNHLPILLLTKNDVWMEISNWCPGQHLAFGIHCLKVMKTRLMKYMPFTRYAMNNDVYFLLGGRDTLKLRFPMHVHPGPNTSSWAPQLGMIRALLSSWSMILPRTPALMAPLSPEAVMIEYRPDVGQGFFYRIIYFMAGSTKHRGNFTFRNLLFSWFEIMANQWSIFHSYNSSAIAYSRSRVPLKIYWIWLMIARDLFYGPSMQWSSLRCTYITRIELGSHTVAHQETICARVKDRDKAAERSGFYLGCLRQNNSSGR